MQQQLGPQLQSTAKESRLEHQDTQHPVPTVVHEFLAEFVNCLGGVTEEQCQTKRQAVKRYSVEVALLFLDNDSFGPFGRPVEQADSTIGKGKTDGAPLGDSGHAMSPAGDQIRQSTPQRVVHVLRTKPQLKQCLQRDKYYREIGTQT